MLQSRCLTRKQLAPGPRFGLDAPAHEVAQLQDVTIGQMIVGVQAIATSGHEPELVEPGQMLRGVRLRQPGVVDELTDRALAFPQRAEQPHTRRISEGLEALRDQFGQLFRHVRFRHGAPRCAGGVEDRNVRLRKI